MANPSVVVGSINDKEIKATIDSLVSHVDAAVKKMAEGFNTALVGMQQSLKSFGDVSKGISTASRQRTTSAKQEVAANKETTDSYQALVNAMRQAEQRANKRWSTGDEILNLRANINALKLELQNLDATNTQMQNKAWKDLFQKAMEERMAVSRYQEEIKRLQSTPTTNRHEQQAIIQQIEIYKQKIEEAKQKEKEFDEQRRKTLSTDYVSGRRNELTQQLEQANGRIREMRQEMERVAQEEQKATQSAQQLAQGQAKVSEEVKKQAQAIRESEQFQQKGFYSIKSSVQDGREYIVYAKSKLSIEEQLVQVKNQEEEAERRISQASKQSAQSLQEEAFAAARAELAAKQMAQSMEAAKTAQGASGSKPTRFQDFADLQAAIDHVNTASKKRVQIVNEETAAYYKMQPALRYMQEAYNRLNVEQRGSDMGKNLADQIQRTSRAMQQLQAQMNRPVSFKAALGLSENTLDDIAYKMRQLSSYRSGLDVKRQANEIKTVSNEIDRLRKKQDELIGNNGRLMQSNNALARSWNYMKNRLAFYFTVGASTQFVKNLIDVRSQYEMTERSLGILIDSAEKGTQIFNQLSDMALISPYTLIELSTAAKQLAAYDVAAKDVVDTTRRLADMAAAVGIPIDRLTYALGQIKAYGYLNARDARMFANAGIPLVKQLSEYYTELEGRMVSVGDIYDRIKKKSIGYNEVMSVINKMTDEGGKFFDFQAKMAGTLKVQLANLTLAWNNMLNDIGKGNQGVLYSTIGLLKNLFLEWKKFDRAISSILRVAGVLGVFKALQFGWIMFSRNVTVGMAMQEVAGAKLTGKLVALKSAWVGLVSSPVTWIALAAFALSDMYGTVSMANEAVKELNKSIRDGAKENQDSLNKLLDSFSEVYKISTNASTGKVSSVEYIGSKSTEDMEKSWNAIREELEVATASSQTFIGRLTKITNLSERLQEAFKITAELRDAQGALSDIDEKAIQVAQDYSAWWNLGSADKGLIGDLKKVDQYMDKIEAFNKGELPNSNLEVLTQAYEKYFEGFEEAAQTTATKISELFSNLKFNPEQMREGFEQISNKIFEGKGLDPQTELRGRMELEAKFVAERRRLAEQSISELLRMGEQAEAQQQAMSFAMWQQRFGQNQVLVNGFYSWLKSHHASDLQSMFGQMTQEEINHINWSEPEWQEWAMKNAKAFSEQYHVSFDDLWNMVKLASTWQVHIGVILDTTAIQKSEYEILKNWDTQANNAYQAIGRLNTRINELNNKTKRTKEEEDELQKARKERQSEQEKYNDATGHGGKSSKEEAANRKAEAAANKRARAGAKAQKQAEDEVAKALKDELSLIKEMQSNYDKLRKAGVANVDAINIATQGYEETIKRVNNVLSKYGINKFNASEFAGKNVKQLLDKLQKQRDALIASGKVKQSSLKDLEVEIQKLTIDAKAYDLKKVTDGLNSELSKLKDDYELAIELDANPELGEMFSSFFGLDDDAISKMPHTIGELVDKYQSVVDSKLNQLKITTPFNLLSDDIDEWANNVEQSIDSELYNALKQRQGELRGIVKKFFVDTQSMVDDYILKYGELQAQLEKIEKEKNNKLADLNSLYRTEELRQTQEYINARGAIEDEARIKAAKATYEALKKTDDYDRFFTRINTLTTKDAISIKAKIKQGIVQAFKDGGLTVAEFIKELKALERQFDKLSEETSGWINYLNGGFDKLIQKARETGSEIETIGEKISVEGKVDDKDKNFLQSLGSIFSDGNGGSMDFASLMDKFGSNMQGLGESVSQAGQGMQEGASSFSQVVAIIDTIVKNIHQAVQAVSAVIDELDSVRSEENKISDAYWEGFKKFDNYAYSGWENLKNGNVMGAMGDTVNSIVTIFNTAANAYNEKINKAIKESERNVIRLDNAYKVLQQSMEQAYGVAQAGASRLAIANKRLQLAELERQLELEKSRKEKNRDTNKILEYEGRIIDLNNEINNSLNDITNTLLGISSVGDAAESMVLSMIEAFKNGEDWMKSYDETFESMIDNIIMKAIVGRVIGERIQKIFDYVDNLNGAERDDIANQIALLTQQRNEVKAAIEDTKSTMLSMPVFSQGVFNDILLQLEEVENGFNRQISELTAQYDELGQITPENVDYLRELVESEREGAKRDFEFWAEVYGLRYGQNKDASNLSALQQGIQGITEDTAGALEAYMNSVSQQVYLHSDLLTQIRDAVVELDGSVQMSVQAQMLLQMQQSYQVQTAIQAILLGWSNASGLAVKVEMV